MSFIAQEQGVETSSPIELYDFTYDAVTWRYTSADAPFTDPGTLAVYDPIEIRRGAIEFANDFAKSGLEIEIIRTAEILDLFRIAPPSGVVSVTIRRVHRTDGATQIVVIWKGRALGVTWATGTATMNCESIRASVQRFGLRSLFQLQCSKVLYSATCGVSRASEEVLGTVTAISGSSVTVSGATGYGDDYFAGGYGEWSHVGLAANERRMISSSISGSGVVVMVGVPIGLAIGSTIRLYPGCDHTLDTCDAKFGNSANFGGFPHTPTKNKNPFGGSAIY